MSRNGWCHEAARGDASRKIMQSSTIVTARTSESEKGPGNLFSLFTCNVAQEESFGQTTKIEVKNLESFTVLHV